MIKLAVSIFVFLMVGLLKAEELEIVIKTTNYNKIGSPVYCLLKNNSHDVIEKGILNVNKMNDNGLKLNFKNLSKGQYAFFLSSFSGKKNSFSGNVNIMISGKGKHTEEFIFKKNQLEKREVKILKPNGDLYDRDIELLICPSKDSYINANELKVSSNGNYIFYANNSFEYKLKTRKSAFSKVQFSKKIKEKNSKWLLEKEKLWNFAFYELKDGNETLMTKLEGIFLTPSNSNNELYFAAINGEIKIPHDHPMLKKSESILIRFSDNDAYNLFFLDSGVKKESIKVLLDKSGIDVVLKSISKDRYSVKVLGEFHQRIYKVLIQGKRSVNFLHEFTLDDSNNDAYVYVWAYGHLLKKIKVEKNKFNYEIKLTRANLIDMKFNDLNIHKSRFRMYYKTDYNFMRNLQSFESSKIDSLSFYSDPKIDNYIMIDTKNIPNNVYIKCDNIKDKILNYNFSNKNTISGDFSKSKDSWHFIGRKKEIIVSHLLTDEFKIMLIPGEWHILLCSKSKRGIYDLGKIQFKKHSQNVKIKVPKKEKFVAFENIVDEYLFLNLILQ